MSIRFEMIGKLDLAKDSDKRKGFEELRYKKGEKDKNGQPRKSDFISRTLRLTMKSNEDFFNLRIKGNLFGDENTAIIKSSKKMPDGKYELVEFKYKDREKYTNDLAEFKKFVFVNGEERHEFATEYEYSMFIHNLLSSGEVKDKIFKVVGEIEYSDYTDPNTKVTKTYMNYNITRIYIVNYETEETSTANVDIYINEGSVDDSNLSEGLFKINGYIPQYDRKKKGDKGYFQVLEYPLNVEENKIQTKFNFIKKLLEVQDCELAKIGFKVNLINRVEEVEFDESMLSDEDRLGLELEVYTLSDFKDKYGNGKGGYVSKMEVSNVNSLYKKGCIPTQVVLSELLSDGEKEEKEPELNLEGSLTDNELDDMDIFD